MCSRFRFLLHVYKLAQEKDTEREETCPFKNPPPGGEKAKGSASLMGKL
jgi:hypothetical protein